MEEVAQAIAEDQAKAASQAQQPPAPSAPDLNISDLAALKSIVEISSQRGTFKAGELEAVGKIYNKLSMFLEAVTKQKEA